MKSYLIAIAVAAFIALGIRSFFLESYRIPNSAMRPTLVPGDMILSFKWPFGFHFPFSDEKFIDGQLPQYGDVVVFKLPKDMDVPSRLKRIRYVKRIVGLPGDRIRVEAGRVIYNGEKSSFSSPRGWSGQSRDCGTEQHPKAKYSICLGRERFSDSPEVTVSDDHVFVIGDNRRAGSSPFEYGLVPIDELKSKAGVIWLSLNLDRTRKNASSDGGFAELPKIRKGRILKWVN